MIPSLFSKSSIRKTAIVSTLALIAGSAIAQENRIQLRSLDGAMSLEGAFIGFRDGVYVLDHDSLGTLRIEATPQIICEGPACPGNEEPEVEAEPEPVVIPVSKTVKLSTSDGRLSIEGDFVELTQTAFVIDAPTLGRLAIEIIPGLECEGEACPDLTPQNGPRTISGTTREMVKMLPTLLNAYAAERGAMLESLPVDEDGNLPIRLATSDGSWSTEFLISSGGAEDAFDDFSKQNASFVISDRRISDDDVNRLGIPDYRGTSNEARLAQDGLVLVLHDENPIQSLTTQEVSLIWSGIITNWNELGGPDADINVTSAIITASDWRLFSSAILLPNSGSTNAITSVEDVDAFIEGIETDIGTIGMARWSDVSPYDLKMIDIVQSCGLASEPSNFTLQNGEYRLAQSMYSYLNTELAETDLADFAQFVSSNDTLDLIAGLEYVSTIPVRQTLREMNNALLYTASGDIDFSVSQLRQTVGTLQNAERTSIAFRFKEGSSQLDQDSVLAVNQLIEKIRSGELADYEILLVGFSDSSGGAAPNTALALNRSVSVEQALRAELPAELAQSTLISNFSAGEMFPLWCNDTDQGRERNRRVEAWLRKVEG